MTYQIVIRDFKLFLVTLLVWFFLTPCFADFSRVWNIASPSVVSVLPTWPGYNKPGFGAPPGTAPEGTGIVVSKNGLIITASHVISKASEIEIRDTLGVKRSAKVILNDLQTDIALLKSEIYDQQISFALGPSDVGSKACLISNAFGLDLSITCGVISAIGRKGIGFNRIEDFIQTDAASNPGSSGGALVDQEGRLIGMMSGIFTKNTDTNSGVNFAISSNLIKKTISKFLDDDDP